jgi:hypothetical protein
MYIERATLPWSNASFLPTTLLCTYYRAQRNISAPSFDVRAFLHVCCTSGTVRIDKR